MSLKKGERAEASTGTDTFAFSCMAYVSGRVSPVDSYVSILAYRTGGPVYLTIIDFLARNFP